MFEAASLAIVSFKHFSMFTIYFYLTTPIFVLEFSL